MRIPFISRIVSVLGTDFRDLGWILKRGTIAPTVAAIGAVTTLGLGLNAIAEANGYHTNLVAPGQSPLLNFLAIAGAEIFLLRTLANRSRQIQADPTVPRNRAELRAKYQTPSQSIPC